MQVIAVADDIVGARRTDQGDRNILGNQGFEEPPPHLR